MQNSNSNYSNHGQIQYRLPGDQQPTLASQKPNVTFLPGPHGFQLPPQRSSPNYSNASQMPQTNASTPPVTHRQMVSAPLSPNLNLRRQTPQPPPPPFTTQNGHPDRSQHQTAPSNHGHGNPSSSVPTSHDSSHQTRPPRTPVVSEMVAAVLGPTHKLFADAWRETTARVQVELQNVHNTYSGLLKYEKDITEQAIETCKQLKAEAEAAQEGKARAEAERNGAMYEVARLQGDKAAQRQAMENMANGLNRTVAQNEELKKRVDILLGERRRLRAEWDLARVMRLKLQEENLSLKGQLSEGTAASDSVAPPNFNDEATKTNGAVTQDQTQVEAPININFSSTTDCGWAQTSGESRTTFDQVSPGKTSTEADDLELQYPPPPSQNGDANLVDLSDPSFTPSMEVIPIHSPADMGYGGHGFVESDSMSRELVAKKSPSVKARSRSRSPRETMEGGEPPYKRSRRLFAGQGEDTVDHLGVVGEVKEEHVDF